MDLEIVERHFRFREHEKSDTHKQATEKVAVTSSGRDVCAQLNAPYAVDALFHKKIWMKLLSYIKFVMQQGLALQGNHEDVHSLGGNLYQLLLLQAQEDRGSGNNQIWESFFSPNPITWFTKWPLHANKQSYPYLLLLLQNCSEYVNV